MWEWNNINGQACKNIINFNFKHFKYTSIASIDYATLFDVLCDPNGSCLFAAGHLPTLSAAKTSKLSLLVKSPFWWLAAYAGNATPTFCFTVPAISKLTTLTVESLLTAPTETTKHLNLAIDEAS